MNPPRIGCLWRYDMWLSHVATHRHAQMYVALHAACGCSSWRPKMLPELCQLTLSMQINIILFIYLFIAREKGFETVEEIK